MLRQQTIYADLTDVAAWMGISLWKAQLLHHSLLRHIGRFGCQLCQPLIDLRPSHVVDSQVKEVLQKAHKSNQCLNLQGITMGVKWYTS